MRESEPGDGTDSGYTRTLAAQGYRLLSSSTPEPPQPGRRGASYAHDWSRPVRSSSSAHDLRRSPTVGEYDGRRWRVAAAVRRSRSTVGDDRRLQAAAAFSPTSQLSAGRRSSADLALHSTPSLATTTTTMVTTTEFSLVAGEPPTAFPTPAGQQAAYGWYYGLEGGLLNRQPPAATHDVRSQTDQTSLSSSAESRRGPETGCRDVASTGWSGTSWTALKKLQTSPMPADGEKDASDGRTAVLTKNPVIDSDVASNYILRRESFTPVARLYTPHWPIDTAHGLPEIRVTPATDEHRAVHHRAISVLSSYPRNV